MRFERQTFWLPRPAKWLIPAAAMVAFVLWYNRDRTASAVSLSRLQQAGAMSNWAVVRSDGYRYLKQHPADDEAILWVARAEASDSQFDKSLRLLAKVPASSPRSAEARLREGQSQRQLFHAVAAERSFTEAVEQGLASGAPPSVVDSARLGLVQLYATEARNTEARRLIWELHRTSPQPAAVLELLGRLDIEGAEPNEAGEIARKFLEKDPTDLEARRALAHHYLVLGRAREAGTLAQECVQAGPDFLAAWETLLASLSELGDFAALEAALDRAPPPGRETAWFCKYRAVTAERQEQPASAAEAFEHALEHDPFDSRLHYLLGRVYHQLGNGKASAEQIARSQELTAARARLRELYRQVILSNQRGSGPSSELSFNMGRHYELVGVYDAAAAWYRESLSRDPANAMSRERLARLELLPKKELNQQ